jgi:PIN domain nuclease of toxin-antitoxin system
MGIGLMILLDTHIWVWWVNESPDLSQKHKRIIEESTSEGLGVSVISCWEVANLVRLGRLVLNESATMWITNALSVSEVRLLELSPRIAIEATELREFHKDPADRFLVATARFHDIPIMTKDARILDYPDVKVITPS